MIELSELGQIGLFLSAFLAATFFPIGCEAIFVALLIGVKGLGDGHLHFTVVNATLGNTLGAIVTYYIGMHLPIERALRVVKIKKSRFKRVHSFVIRRAKMMAFLSWLPILGDPIALALGHARANIVKIAPMMALGKYLRFLILGIFSVLLKDSFF